ncbi:hypothetical protein EVAR_100834_1 [Eumeta japonica]|uniref:Uncharacterized protein n=1 Tax=Eumeta variegata TaxID=151549 RepID=A0A4C1SFQ1_EUMVA|nr:hypothetical protein EVAR_100834_1 [Eumeta japonica]
MISWVHGRTSEDVGGPWSGGLSPRRCTSRLLYFLPTNDACGRVSATEADLFTRILCFEAFSASSVCESPRQSVPVLFPLRLQRLAPPSGRGRRDSCAGRTVCCDWRNRSRPILAPRRD